MNNTKNDDTKKVGCISSATYRNSGENIVESNKKKYRKMHHDASKNATKAYKFGFKPAAIFFAYRKENQIVRT